VRAPVDSCGPSSGRFDAWISTATETGDRPHGMAIRSLSPSSGSLRTPTSRRAWPPPRGDRGGLTRETLRKRFLDALETGARPLRVAPGTTGSHRNQDGEGDAPASTRPHRLPRPHECLITRRDQAGDCNGDRVLVRDDRAALRPRRSERRHTSRPVGGLPDRESTRPRASGRCWITPGGAACRRRASACSVTDGAVRRRARRTVATRATRERRPTASTAPARPGEAEDSGPRSRGVERLPDDPDPQRPRR